MRLIRLWPDNSHFDFMRFRRFSFPLSAFISVLTVVLLLTVGLNFGIDFKGGTLMELQAKSGQADVGQVRQTAEGFGFGEVEVQEFGTAGEVSLRFAIQAGGEAAQSGRGAEGARHVQQRLRVPPRRDGRARASRASSCSPAPSASSSRSSRSCSISGSASSASWRWRHHRHAARHRADHRLLRDHRPRVQHDLDRGDPDHRRLFAERDRGGVRPHPRADAPLQDACRPRSCSTCRSTTPCRAR